MYIIQQIYASLWSNGYNQKFVFTTITTKQNVGPEDLPGGLVFLGHVVAFYQDCLLLL